MLTLAIKLLLAHIIGDFVLQPTKWVNHKLKNGYKSKYLIAHIAVHLATLLVVLQFNLNYIAGILAILITHYGIDILKIKYTTKKNSSKLFIADQLAHILVISIVVYCYAPFIIDVDLIYQPQLLLLITLGFFVTFVTGILMRLFLQPWQDAIEPNIKSKNGKTKSTSLAGAGKIIGMLERLFVFGFILLNAWSAIGFLIAAKSVFRFGDLTEGKNRQLTEYVLIGTLLSFGIAIGAGLTFNYLDANFINPT
ncbi:DUF3307 domain-containing protein [Leeuwenhoekiella sp. NPDC079379]|uniref:DUF3307 domain-containing protein n=1 Tax=Leeuwenhoekiella sp. NPDC079379 TaxID=3364122 RepID=UPI0037C85C9A